MNNGQHAKEVRESPRLRLWIPLAIVGILLIAGVSILFIPFGKSDTMIPCNTSIAGVDVGGLSAKQAVGKIDEAIRNRRIVLTYNNERMMTTYANIGITAHTDEAVGEALESQSLFNRIAGRNIGIRVSEDAIATQNAINAGLRIKNPVSNDSLMFIADRNIYTVSRGRRGNSIDMSALNERIIGSSCSQSVCTGSIGNLNGSVNVGFSNVNRVSPPVMKNEGRVLSTANNLLYHSYGVSIDGTVSNIDKARQSQWVGLGERDGNAVLVYNSAAIEKTMTAFLSSLGTPATSQIVMVSPDGGQNIATVQYGVNGTTGAIAGGVAAAAERYVDAMRRDADAVLSATMQTVAYGVTRRRAPSNFDVANGSPWVEVNLSDQTATAYRGTTPVKTFEIATGTGNGSDDTDNGTFYVDVKYVSQTMRGADYVSPDVPWVSYFNGSIAFHGASWNTYNIEHGVPSSHGCCNMFVGDARWMYDFAPIGTMVRVIGTTPSGAVR